MIQIRTVEVATELPVFLVDLTEIQPQLDLARQGLEELRVTHPDSIFSNVKANYVSPWHSHLINPKFKPLTESVITIAKEVSRNQLSANLPGLNLDLVVTDCWGMIYENQNYTQRHNHFPAEFSCSIYLEAQEDSAPILFAGRLNVKPKKNLLVLFPGILIHEVPPTSGLRVVIAMNLNKMATFSNFVNENPQTE